MKRALLIVLAACKSSAPARPVVVTAPPAVVDAAVATEVPAATATVPKPLPGLATADMVLVVDTDLVAFTLENPPRELGRTKLVEDAEELSFFARFVWADRDHVIISYGEPRKVALIGTTETRFLELPPAAVYDKIARPTVDDSENLRRGTGEGQAGRIVGPVVKKDGTYWDQCVWGFPYDGFQCVLMASTRIWPADPTHAITTSEVDNYEMATALENHGFVDAKAAFPVGGKEDDVAWCKTKKGKRIEIPNPSDLESHFYEAHWLGTSLILVYGTMGLTFSPTSFAVFESCTEKPKLSGSWIALYPDKWFAVVSTGPTGDDEGEPTSEVQAFRGLAKIGVLPSSAFELRPNP